MSQPRGQGRVGPAHGLGGRAAAPSRDARGGPALLRLRAPPGRAPGSAPRPSATAATNEVRGRRERLRCWKGGRPGPRSSRAGGLQIWGAGVEWGGSGLIYGSRGRALGNAFASDSQGEVPGVGAQPLLAPFGCPGNARLGKAPETVILSDSPSF